MRDVEPFQSDPDCKKFVPSLRIEPDLAAQILHGFFLHFDDVLPGIVVPLWKILHLVGADWTYGTKGWAAENYCMFLADNDAWKHIVETKVKAVEDLGCKVWLNTE